MDCGECGAKYTELLGDFPFQSKALGTVIVPMIKHYKCERCGDRLLDFEQSKKVTDYVEARERDIIESLPIGEFVSATQTAAMLSMSKQALSKNIRIKRGFIYSVNIGSRKLYYKNSVEHFKNTGDGRIKLMGRLDTYFSYLQMITVQRIESIPDLAIDWQSIPGIIELASQEVGAGVQINTIPKQEESGAFVWH